MFQQDSAPTHMARKTADPLTIETRWTTECDQ